MPLKPRPKATAHRLCQPMHVLSCGEGRRKLFACLEVTHSHASVACDHVTYFAPTRPRSGGSLKGDSIESSLRGEVNGLQTSGCLV
jgi:hypothetical protein